MPGRNTKVSLPDERIFSKIYLIRGQKVMFDSDLADLYEVETKMLKRAVRRNINRFPDDFMFELTREEWKNLRFQFGTSTGNQNLRSQSGTSSAESNSAWGGTRYPPFAFTEQGVAMLSGILNSPRAIAVNIQIMRIFVKMRQMITGYKELLSKIEKLEADQENSNKHIGNIYKIIKELLEPEYKNREPVSFKIKERKKKN